MDRFVNWETILWYHTVYLVTVISAALDIICYHSDYLILAVILHLATFNALHTSELQHQTFECYQRELIAEDHCHRG